MSGAGRGLRGRLHELAREARARTGSRDVAWLLGLEASCVAAELAGRLCLHLAEGPGLWLVGAWALAYQLSVKAQLNHSVMHGAFAGLPGAERFTPERYETLAIPFRSKTWGDAHRVHHQHPSLLDGDPDTAHPLFRVHPGTPFRWWHRLNAFVGALFTFELWALDYDRFLKRTGRRAASDRGELRKLAAYVGWQLVLFPALAGARWGPVLLGGLFAVAIRNLIFTALQTASSVGAHVSTRHAERPCPPRGDERVRFQVETSKNFELGPLLRILCGGLDRHIEHHLFPHLPPSQLHALAPEVRALCRAHGIRYEEHPSLFASLRDSVGWLRRLGRAPRPEPPS